MADRQFLELLTRQLADEGKIVEAGWIVMRLQFIDPNAPAIQLEEMRLAFLAGAQHVYASMMTFIEPGREVTDPDMRRMELLTKELEVAAEEIMARTRKRAKSN